MSQERRRSPRIELLGQLHGRVVAYDVSVVVRNVSLGGMSLESAFPFTVGVVHAFRLTLGDRSLIVKGRVAHCSISDVDQELVTYRSGIQFVEPSERVIEVISGFIEAIKDGRRAI